MKRIFGKAFMKAFGTVVGIYTAVATVSFINSALARKTEEEKPTKNSAKEDEIL